MSLARLYCLFYSLIELLSMYKKIFLLILLILIIALLASNNVKADWEAIGGINKNTSGCYDPVQINRAFIRSVKSCYLSSINGNKLPVRVVHTGTAGFRCSARTTYVCEHYFPTASAPTPCSNSDQTWDQSIESCISSDEMPLADSNNNGENENLTCDPINIASGNKFFKQINYRGRGVDPLSLRSSFNSNSGEYSWGYSYSQYLDINTKSIKLVRDSGKKISFLLIDGLFFQVYQSEEVLLVEGDGYLLRLPNGVVERYNSLGELLSIQYPSGITHNLTYTNNNNTVTITRLNESLVLELVDGNVVKATLPDSSEINYTWDTSGTIDNLITVTYADNSTRTYLYENTQFPHYVTGIVDENNNRISSVEYDTQGRAISSEVGTPNSGIDRTEIVYHEDGTRTVTNSLGKQNTYHFTQFNGEYKMTQVEGHASANCAAANQAYTYDTNGFMASSTDWNGNITTYIHNDRGLETSRTEASGTPQARTITTEWHPTFNLRTKITEPERETLFSYDDQGRLTSQEVNAL